MARNFGYGLEYTNCDNLKVLGIILPVKGKFRMGQYNTDVLEGTRNGQKIWIQS